MAMYVGKSDVTNQCVPDKDMLCDYAVTSEVKLN